MIEGHSVVTIEPLEGCAAEDRFDADGRLRLAWLFFSLDVCQARLDKRIWGR